MKSLPVEKLREQLCQKSVKISTFFVKTKNVPYGLKCKINTKNFFWIRGSQKGGVGGGSDVWEKFPNNIVFFLRAYLSFQNILNIGFLIH